MTSNIWERGQRWPLLFMLGLMFFLTEQLTWPSLIAAVVAIYPVWKGMSIPDRLLKGLAIGVFASYVIIYRKILDPEIGMNFMFCIFLLKMVEAKEERDDRMIFLAGLILLGAGTLFVRTAPYVVFCIVGLLGQFIYLSYRLKEQHAISYKNLFWWAVKALPLVVVLFVVAPRFSSTLWMPPQALDQSRLGFSEEVQLSQVEKLNPNNQLAFTATISEQLSANALYWRGHTLSLNDGWNWSSGSDDVVASHWVPAAVAPEKREGEMVIDIILPRPSRRLFSLFTPQMAYSLLGKTTPSSAGQFWLSPMRQIKRAQIYSSKIEALAPLGATQFKPYQLVIGSMQVRRWAKSLWTGNVATSLLNLQHFFQQQNFVYSLSPGLQARLDDFLFIGKKGFCGHYASATATVLRLWGVPTRLVSGYLGGNYNPMSGAYRVRENDAHVWVEYFSEGKWLHLDPTVWVAPERATMDGESYFRTAAAQDLMPWQRWATPEWMRTTQQWFDSVNFKLLVWSESYDKNAQKELSREWNISLQQLYMTGLWLMGLGLFVYYAREKILDWWISRQKGQLLILVNKLVAKAKSHGINLPVQAGPGQWKQELSKLPSPKRENFLNFVDEWENVIYRQKTLSTQAVALLARQLRRL